MGPFVKFILSNLKVYRVFNMDCCHFKKLLFWIVTLIWDLGFRFIIDKTNFKKNFYCKFCMKVVFETLLQWGQWIFSIKILLKNKFSSISFVGKTILFPMEYFFENFNYVLLIIFNLPPKHIVFDSKLEYFFFGFSHFKINFQN